jgi:ABC-type sugar transport system substrate-binding protein
MTLMSKLRVVVSLPNDNAYQHQQGIAATSAGEKFGCDVQIMYANDDSITQSQQLLEIVQSRSAAKPDAFLVEPVTATGLPRVAEAAVAAGIGWVISNSDVDYVSRLRKTSQLPIFTVTQGQREIGRLQGQQLAALLPGGGSVLLVEGPSMSSVAVQRRQGMQSAISPKLQITALRSKWSEASAEQSVAAWLKLATSQAERFHLVAGQTHELALGARKAFQTAAAPEEKARWQEKPFIGIGISNHVKPLIESRALTAAVVTSVTMELALKILVQACKSKIAPPEHNIIEASSLPDLAALSAR